MLHSSDPEMFNICKAESMRQQTSIELVASENIFSEAVYEAVASSFYNRYSDEHVGYCSANLGKSVEDVCRRRALELFHLSPEDWGVDVRPYSGSSANFEVYTSLVGRGGKIMGLAMVDGGHMTHGHVEPSGKRPSGSSIYFESLAYNVDKTTCLIDFISLEKKAIEFQPKLIIAGASAYPRHLDYAQYRQIADKVGAILLADSAHISGLIATGLHPSPFEYADVVTTTTHKTLRCGRGALIFYRKRRSMDNGRLIPTDYESRIREAVYPGMQGGSQYFGIAGIAVGLLEASKPAFTDYMRRVVSNAQRFAKSLHDKYGYNIVTGGTDTHLFILDLRPLGLDGNRVYPFLVDVGINVDYWPIPGQSASLSPQGIRIGTPNVTSRGFGVKEMEKIASFLHAGLSIAKNFAAHALVEDFKVALKADDEAQMKIIQLREQVAAFAASFPISFRIEG